MSSTMATTSRLTAKTRGRANAVPFPDLVLPKAPAGALELGVGLLLRARGSVCVELELTLPCGAHARSLAAPPLIAESGVGSNGTQPMPVKYASTHEWASKVLIGKDPVAFGTAWA
jgi:hypothetical protein